MQPNMDTITNRCASGPYEAGALRTTAEFGSKPKIREKFPWWGPQTY
jgi:hypothetical protein